MPDSATKQYPAMNPVLSRSIACVALRFGRNPCEHGRKSASNTGSSTSLAACWATLSRTVGTVASYCPSLPWCVGILRSS